jgi:uncharacterized protein
MRVMSSGTPTVRHAPEVSRYELWLGERLGGVADYRRSGGVVDLHHTAVDPDLRGRGLAAQLTDFALDDLEAQGAEIRASCWYVAARLRDRAAR